LTSHVRRVAWIGLVVAVGSGLIWLQLQTVSITGVSFVETLTSDALPTVVGETQFGQVSLIRLGLALALAVTLAGDRRAPLRWLALVAALGFTAAIAWTGHAGSTAGELGPVHLASDILHLWAASAWTGGLILLLLLLMLSRRGRAKAWRDLERDAVRRFSTLGILSVATLVASGIINAWIIVASWQALVATAYGELLLLKVAVVGAMVILACINRFWLTPRLAARTTATADPEALQSLARHTAIEFALGLLVFAIVGALGLQHPVIHP
jgi:putative copper resistance protein D